MSETTIEWTRGADGSPGFTWNPVRGCSRISPGCQHCYAERMAARNLPGMKSPTTGEPFAIMRSDGPHWTGKVELIPSMLDVPLKRLKPTTWFVNSMSDLFHDDLSDREIGLVFAAMAVSHQHTFQVLTKRSERMLKWFERGGPRKSDIPQFDVAGCVVNTLARRLLVDSGRIPKNEFTERKNEWIDRYPWLHASGPMMRWPLPKVWLGVSVESRDYLSRIDDLRRTPAAIRFLSIEPLLEDLGPINLEGIHWVITGCESGPNARPMNEDWVRSIRNQCVEAGVPFFYKQKLVNGKKHGLPELDGRTWDQMPEPVR